MFSYLLSKYLSNIYYMPGTIQDAGRSDEQAFILIAEGQTQ